MKGDWLYIILFAVAMLVIVGVFIGVVWVMSPASHKPVPTPTPTPAPAVIAGGPVMTITFIDVGQGDSEFIEFPNGKVMLIDAGQSSNASEVLEVTGFRNVIDAIAISHPHADHIGGLETVLSRYRGDRFYDIGYPGTSEVYETLLKKVEVKGLSYATVNAFNAIDTDPMVTINVLNPNQTVEGDINDNSMVLHMTYRNFSVLFTGDAGIAAEEVYATELSKVDVLKVAHHGSDTATGSYLINHTRPGVSVISVGADNIYGQPDAEVIGRLEEAGSQIYRTDVCGNVVVTTDGERYEAVC